MFFDIGCPHFALCSGCRVDKAVNNPPVLREMVSWFRGVGVTEFPVFAGAPEGWRMRAKLAIQGTTETPLLGLYAEGSHNVVDIPFCRVHHPAINLGASLIRGFIKNNQVSLYNEKTRKGELRYLQFIVERSTGRLHVSFVLNLSQNNSDRLGFWRGALKDLWEVSSSVRWHSFSINLNTRSDNVIVGSQWECWFGDPHLWERFMGVDVCFLPSSFAQANLDQFEALLGTVSDWVPPGARVAEYYAGVGAIGLTLVNKCGEVRCCEINPFAEGCFRESFKRLSGAEAEKISWHNGASWQFAGWLDDADVVIVDPPRKGLESEFLKSLGEDRQVERLVYMSCGWDSFQRDAKVLLSAGWQIKKAEGHLFFPGSNHIETLVLFGR